MKKNFKTLLFVAATLLGISSCAPTPTKPNYDKYVTGVSLDKNYIELDVKQQFTLTPTISYKDNEKVDVFTQWISGDTTVATVENGVITAKASGDCNISFIAGYKQAICQVHVKGQIGPVPPGPTPGEFSITLNRASAEISILETLTLYATTSEPATVTWSSTNAEVAIVNQVGEVTPLAGGTTTIIASANGKSATCTVTVNEEADYDCTIYFFIDYNNIDEEDTTGTKLIAKFDWYQEIPLSESGKVPANPTNPMDPAFPRFLGWSAHTIIDQESDLWNMETDSCHSYFLYLYGIWVEN